MPGHPAATTDQTQLPAEAAALIAGLQLQPRANEQDIARRDAEIAGSLGRT